MGSMTDTEINIAIAEACGWKHCLSDDTWLLPEKGWLRNPPNYCGDLNAMHEAEKTLNTVQRIDYVGLLEGKHTPIKDQTWTAFHATAYQRAEAYVRTIGKWKDA